MSTQDDVLVPLARAAEIAGRSYAAIYGAGLRGHIRLRRVGRRIFVPLRDLEEFQADRRSPRVGPAAIQGPNA